MAKLTFLSPLFFVLLCCIACGGSSSETPMPLEPMPHAGPDAPEDEETDDKVGGPDEAPPEDEAESIGNY